MRKAIDILKDILAKSLQSLCAVLLALGAAMICTLGVWWASERMGISHHIVSLALLIGSLVAGVCWTAWDRRRK